MLQNESSVAKIGVSTAENEPREGLKTSIPKKAPMVRSYVNEAMEFMKEQKGETNGARQTMKGIERLLGKADQKVTDLDRRRLQEAQVRTRMNNNE